jgi:hypothetical protein
VFLSTGSFRIHADMHGTAHYILRHFTVVLIWRYTTFLQAILLMSGPIQNIYEAGMTFQLGPYGVRIALPEQSMS